MNNYSKLFLATLGLALTSVSNAKSTDININESYSTITQVYQGGINKLKTADIYKKKKPNVSGKDGSKDIPSWAKGKRPYLTENGTAFAKRLMDNKYPNGGYQKGAGSEYSAIKKYGDRAF